MDLFYCKPLPVAPNNDQAAWYYDMPIGKNLLGNMVKNMCLEAGLQGKKTNHSQHVAGTTSLYEAGVPEKIIQERTGHRCLQSLRHYERVTTEQDVAVSRILTGEIDAYEPKCEKPCHSLSICHKVNQQLDFLVSNTIIAQLMCLDLQGMFHHHFLLTLIIFHQLLATCQCIHHSHLKTLAIQHPPLILIRLKAMTFNQTTQNSVD